MTRKQWIMLIPAVGGIALAILSIYGYESRYTSLRAYHYFLP